MELDEIKMLFKASMEEGIAISNAAELEAALRKKTQSVTAKIRQSIWLETAAFVLCALAAVVCWFVYPTLVVRVFCMATWVFCLVAGIYLCALYKKIVLYETGTGTVKESLERIIQIVTRFTRLYFGISVGLLPVIYFFGMIIGYLDITKQGLLQQFNWSGKMLNYGIAFITGWSAIIYFLSKWYIRKLYGNYLQQLKHQLKDIENG